MAYSITSNELAVKHFARFNAMMEGYLEGRDDPKAKEALAKWQELYNFGGQPASPQGLQKVSRTQNINTTGFCVEADLNTELDLLMIDAIGLSDWLEMKKCLVTLNRFTIGATMQESYVQLKDEPKVTDDPEEKVVKKGGVKAGARTGAVLLIDSPGWQLQQEDNSAMVAQTKGTGHIPKIKNPIIQAFMADLAKDLRENEDVKKYKNRSFNSEAGNISQDAYIAPVVSDLITDLLIAKRHGVEFHNFSKYGAGYFATLLAKETAQDPIWGKNVGEQFKHNECYVQYLLLQGIVIALRKIQDDPELAEQLQGMILRLPSYKLSEGAIKSAVNNDPETVQTIKGMLDTAMADVEAAARAVDIKLIVDDKYLLTPDVYANYREDTSSLRNKPIGLNNGGDGWTVNGNEIYEFFAKEIQKAVTETIIPGLAQNRNKNGFLFGSQGAEDQFIADLDKALSHLVPQDKNAYALLQKLTVYIESLPSSHPAKENLMKQGRDIFDIVADTGLGLDASTAARLSLRSVMECNPHHHKATLYVFYNNKLMPQEEYVRTVFNKDRALQSQLAQDKTAAKSHREQAVKNGLAELSSKLAEIESVINGPTKVTLAMVQEYHATLLTMRKNIGAASIPEKYPVLQDALIKKASEIKQQQFNEVREKLAAKKSTLEELKALKNILNEISQGIGSFDGSGYQDATDEIAKQDLQIKSAKIQDIQKALQLKTPDLLEQKRKFDELTSKGIVSIPDAISNDYKTLRIDLAERIAKERLSGDEIQKGLKGIEQSRDLAESRQLLTTLYAALSKIDAEMKNNTNYSTPSASYTEAYNKILKAMIEKDKIVKTEILREIDTSLKSTGTLDLERLEKELKELKEAGVKNPPSVFQAEYAEFNKERDRIEKVIAGKKATVQADLALDGIEKTLGTISDSDLGEVRKLDIALKGIKSHVSDKKKYAKAQEIIAEKKASIMCQQLADLLADLKKEFTLENIKEMRGMLDSITADLSLISKENENKADLQTQVDGFEGKIMGLAIQKVNEIAMYHLSEKSPEQLKEGAREEQQEYLASQEHSAITATWRGSQQTKIPRSALQENKGWIDFQKLPLDQKVGDLREDILVMADNAHLDIDSFDVLEHIGVVYAEKFTGTAISTSTVKLLLDTQSILARLKELQATLLDVAKKNGAPADYELSQLQEKINLLEYKVECYTKLNAFIAHKENKQPGGPESKSKFSFASFRKEDPDASAKIANVKEAIETIAKAEKIADVQQGLEGLKAKKPQSTALQKETSGLVTKGNEFISKQGRVFKKE
jgi:hypothetical protein